MKAFLVFIFLNVMLEEFFDAISLYSLSLKIKSRRLRKMIT